MQILTEIEQIKAELKAQQRQREDQQGLGRPIISTLFKGERVIAIGNKIGRSKNWRTFHDFLFDYIIDVFGKEWWKVETQKNPFIQHPVIKWLSLCIEFRSRQLDEKTGVIYSSMTGAVAAYMHLSYNLYLIAHNEKIQLELIKRLKDKDGFLGAYYETFVAAVFIKAGFKLEFENESDSRTKHCEFTAIHGETGKKYSVEAKARKANKSNVKIGNQLHKALQKKAQYTRIIFIDMNMPELDLDQEKPSYLDEVVSNMRDKEKSMTINGRHSLKAYVFITNHPFQYKLQECGFKISVISEGFKIPDYKLNAQFRNLKEALKSREKHKEMFKLWESILSHNEIPSTFDGENPEYALTDESSPWKIGHKYPLEDKDGKRFEGKLVDAAVNEKKKRVECMFLTEETLVTNVSYSLSDKEFSAYLRHPGTFFGVIKPQGSLKNFLELYDFFYASYRKTPKKRLLELLNNHPERKSFEKRSQKALAEIYCESAVYWAYKNQSKK